MMRVASNPTNGLAKDSDADALIPRSISVERIWDRMGALDATQLEVVVEAVALCIGNTPYIGAGQP
jgi:hypothetical protein